MNFLRKNENKIYMVVSIVILARVQYKYKRGIA